jgi:hypothetical protein
MQHDLFDNPNRRMRAIYPFLAVLQANLAESEHRIVAPLAVRRVLPDTVPRSMPVVAHDGSDYGLLLPLMGAVPVRLLRHAVGSIAQHRDDITRALDWLLWGV